jgi:hypothetical protein
MKLEFGNSRTTTTTTTTTTTAMCANAELPLLQFFTSASEKGPASVQKFCALNFCTLPAA